MWRYPVKSLQGERLDTADVTTEGLAGDRAFGIVDCATGLVLTGRREPRLLFASAHFDNGAVTIALDDGTVLADDAALSEWLGRPVELRSADPQQGGKYEIQLDFENEETAEWFSWTGPTGPFHDSTKTRVSIVSTASIGAWATRRFRANVVVEGAGEDELVGTTIRLGGSVLDVVKKIDRCQMVTRPQPGGITRDIEVLRTITREREGNLGVGALVVAPGPIAVGDELLR